MKIFRKRKSALFGLLLFPLLGGLLSSCNEEGFSSITISQDESVSEAPFNEVEAEVAKFEEFSLFYRADLGGYLVGDYKGTKTSIQIPEEATDEEGHTAPIVGLADYAFYERKSLEAVVLGENVKYIGEYAFAKSSVTDVRVTYTMDTVSKKAFADSQIALAEFAGIQYLSTQSIKYAIALFDGTSWYDESKEESKVREDCSKAIVMDGVLAIPAHGMALGGVQAMRSALATICIPDSVTLIGSGAFEWCTLLSQIHIPSMDQKLVYYFGAMPDEFSEHYRIATVEVGTPTKSLPKDAFSYLNNITRVKLPDTLEEIGVNAFSNCTGLESVTLPASLSVIQENAFCNAYKLKEVTLPSGLKEIGDGAFAECSGLESIAIPATVDKIGSAVFEACSSLAEITVDPENKIYDSRDGCNAIILTAENKLIVACRSTVIPESVTALGSKAYAATCNVKDFEITIPASITSFESGAFRSFSGLKKVTLGAGITEIPNAMFSECTSLSSINLPTTLKTIGKMGFYQTGLSSVTIPDSVTSLGESAFGNSSLTKASLGKAVKSIGECAFSGTKLTSIIIPASVTKMGKWVFLSCNKLTTIYCRAKSKPSGWDSTWAAETGSNVKIVWGYN